MPKRGLRLKDVDDLFSKYVRARDKWCQRCGDSNPRTLQCAHVIERGEHGVRFDPINAMGLCRGCHYWQTMHRARGDEWFKEHLGEEVFESLRQKAFAWHGRLDLKAIAADLREKLKELETA